MGQTAVDVIDMTDPAVAADVLGGFAMKQVTSTVIKIYPMCGGIEVMVGEVKKAAKPKELEALRLWSHGASGKQNVSAGQSGGGGRHHAGIYLKGFDSIAPVLKGLAALFASPTSRLELRGCNVAYGQEGTNLMLKLAKTLGVRVHGALLEQTGLDWVGPVNEADPSGGIKKVSGYKVY